jgi:tRNA dimethylallyltransferase
VEQVPAAPLIAVVGPTGSGKSELALIIAERFGGEIVNSDSVQLYRHFDIGSAKLAAAARRGVPHHLIGVIDPDEHFSAGEYARRARAILGEITSRGALPVVVGGTGFYLRALLDGLFKGPERDPKLRGRLAERERRKPGSLHRLLRRFDPSSAARIHAGDLQKLTRAVEVCLLTRQPLSRLFAGGRDALQGYQTLKIGLDPPRQDLYERLNARCQRMFSNGLPEEVRRILARGYPPDCKPFESLGYRQALHVVTGETTLDGAVDCTQRDTRRYAKRQWTWFRRDPAVEWFRGFGDALEVQAGVLARIAQFVRNISEIPSF